ncbi:IS701 family transposase [Streptomyces sp. NPDC091272]|uniref:IS701 family transposase n=1 Tax=Streptomyces sp. NPDC091272 TaxID=3365981 RepID=UPI0037FDA356
MAAQHLSLMPRPDGAADLSVFTERLFGHLPRADQRRWAQSYLQGLLSTPGKKSVRRLAAAVSSSPTASQSLQQFINASPWEWEPAREALGRTVEAHTVPRAWTLAAAVLPKRGDHSCGVHRRFVPAVGRTINCQLGLSAFLSSGEEHLPVDWRLMLPEHWNEDARLRERTKIPDSARHRPLWAHALELVDALTARTSLAPVPVVADMSGYLDAVPLVDGLSTRGRDFVLAVPGSLQVLPGSTRPSGPYHGAPDPQRLMTAAHLLHQHSTRQPHTTTLTADGHQRHVRIMSALVRLPGARHTYRVFTEWRPTGRRPPRVWISNMVDHRLNQLSALARLRTGTDAVMDTLQQDYGLLDFEGRSYPGWHHHMTLVSSAYAYSRLLAPARAPAPALPLPHTA